MNPETQEEMRLPRSDKLTLRAIDPGELARAGLLDATEALKNVTVALAGGSDTLGDDAYELEVQLQVFETVLGNDHHLVFLCAGSLRVADRP